MVGEAEEVMERSVLSLFFSFFFFFLDAAVSLSLSLSVFLICPHHRRNRKKECQL